MTVRRAGPYCAHSCLPSKLATRLSTLNTQRGHRKWVLRTLDNLAVKYKNLKIVKPITLLSEAIIGKARCTRKNYGSLFQECRPFLGEKGYDEEKVRK